VPDSTVTVTDAEIGVTRTTKAAGNGYFQIFNLPVGTYKVSATHEGFGTTTQKGISVQEAQAKTLTLSLKVGQTSESVEVTANPMLNATDTTNGYTLDQEQIALTPLATGSFTQLAVLSPGVNAELLSGLDTNAGLGNQPIWANGQRDTSNTFQVNGVDATNLFNGKSSSSATSQRYNFNIGAGGSATSQYGAGTIGGASQTGGSVYGSNGNSLPSPPPEFLQELRVNTSMYDAQQGATSGAQIDANTVSGTNTFHGQAYGTFATNGLNADPFFFKQAYLLSEEGVGAFPESLQNPALHRWTTGATLGGPVLKNKLFFFLGYQHLYASDQSTGLSQFNVPASLGDDRSITGLTNVATAWGGKTYSGKISQQAYDLFNAKLPNGQFLIPSAQSTAAYQYGVPNVTLVGTSLLVGDQGTASLDYDLTKNDRLSAKYYYQNDPLQKPFGYSETGGFPSTTANGAQVGEIDNTISIGSRLNWEQRIGFDRMRTYSYYHQTVTDTTTSGAGNSFGIGSTTAPGYLDAGVLPGLEISEFAVDTTNSSPALKLGPFSVFENTGYFQNRLNPSTNIIFSLGSHTIIAGGGYSYTQLNIRNNRNGLSGVDVSSFQNFLAGTTKSANLLDTIDPASGRNNADRYYRTNEADGYVQDKWQALSNLSITAGVRYDYHGGLTEKYGNIFNFDPNSYNVSGTDTSGFTVAPGGSGFVVAGNNKYNPTQGVSDSTLTGRQWGISPRVGFAFSPKADNGKFVIRGGAGIYYDRGELFSYLSPPAGSSIGGPFGVTEEAPLVSSVTAGKATLANPFGTTLPLSSSTNPPLPSSNPAAIQNALQSQLNVMTSTSPYGYGLTCGAINGEEEGNCTSPLDFGAYNKNNVLPYTINFALDMQWQPRNDLAVTIGYAGNRGRHAVIPIPFNEPAMVSSTNPSMLGGANKQQSGETTNYGEQVLLDTANGDGDLPSIGSEPWSTYDGGNTDFRVPYVGYSPFAALFTTSGNSAYDALETHLEKRLSHHVQAGVSYTWSHALDEQSDIGIFFTGNDPAHLRDSYASADFDRTNVFSANFLVSLPDFAKPHSLLSYVTNGWNMTGIGILQSGEPYSLYEYHGASGSAQFGYYPSLINPVLGIKDPKNVQAALTGQRGAFRGTGGSFIPTINPDEIAINYLSPGQKGVPDATSPGAIAGQPLDVYETDFPANNQRNIFRQASQKRLDLSFRKDFRVGNKVNILYAFNIFNATNTTSLDVPQNQTQLRQNGACDNAIASSNYDCTHNYLFGQVATSVADQGATIGTGAPHGGTAGANLDQLPYVTQQGGVLTVPTELPIGVNNCIASKTVSSAGCVNNGANFGSVTGTIGGNRAITMGVHVIF
jgi:hypothetical protein